MAIQLKPEVEELIRQGVQSGAYASAEEYLERAVRLLHDQETWLAANREDIRELIEEGWLEAERGELVSAEDLKAELKERKKAWVKQHSA
jgi:putative addiction module CopG family antidote